MPSIRIGFATDFNLLNELVGIGTTLPTARLDVAGQIRADSTIGGGGVSTITRYDGFLHTKQGIGNTVSIAQTTKGNLNSLSGEIVISGELTISEGTSVTGGRLDSLTVTNSFTPPSGDTTTREETPERGSTRYNEDLGQLEFYTGYEWRTVGSYDGSGRGRGVFAGGHPHPGSPDSRVIEYINISSLGNSQNFGDLTVERYGGAGMSNSVRAVFGGGWVNPANNLDIYYVTIASEGNAIDFGVDVTGGWGSQGTSSSTRGLAAGGSYPTGTNVIDTILFSTTGVKYDYGDLAGHGTTNNYRGRGMTGCNSPTRSVFFGGYNPAMTSVIESKLTASDGNTVFFGDLISKLRITSGGLSSLTRGVIGGGTNQNINNISLIQYITISTFGNASYFGDLTVSRRGSGAVSTQTRGVFASGSFSPETYFNTIDYITISSVGNAVDFGDLSQAKEQANAASDSHGGLGGF